jgi:hypothetical protein
MRNNPAALMGLASKVVRTVIVKDLTESSPQSGEMFSYATPLIISAKSEMRAISLFA